MSTARPWVLAMAVGMSAGIAFAQQASQACDPLQGACVRELPDPQAGAQESWTQEQPEVPPAGAWVRELPEDYTPPTEWGWTAINVPPDLPAANPLMGVCARSPEQALSWISGPTQTQDETILNRALSAYDWRGHDSASAESLIEWIATWPAGHWEQQTAMEVDGDRYIQRYRYLTEDERVYTWVRAIKTQGCWFLRPAPPRSRDTEHNQNDEQPQAPKPATQDPENLQILWEAPPQG